MTGPALHPYAERRCRFDACSKPLVRAPGESDHKFLMRRSCNPPCLGRKKREVRPHQFEASCDRVAIIARTVDPDADTESPRWIRIRLLAGRQLKIKELFAAGEMNAWVSKRALREVRAEVRRLGAHVAFRSAVNEMLAMAQIESSAERNLRMTRERARARRIERRA